jgi:hypothetical protein
MQAPQASYAGGLKVLLDAWGGLLEVCFTPVSERLSE